MSHFDKAAETSETPSEADKLVSELEAMFGFHPGDSEQSEPTVEKTFDDDPEVKESAIAKLERLLEIRRAEAGATNRDVTGTSPGKRTRRRRRSFSNRKGS